MSGVGRNVYTFIEGAEEDVIRLNGSIEERLCSMEPWYGFLGRSHMGIITAILSVLILIPIARTGRFINLIRSEFGSVPARLMASFVFGGIVGALFGPIFLWLAKSIFPSGVFAIGQGLKRHRVNEWIRGTVVVGFLVSLAAGIAVLFISQ
jgi:hypothetical protein